MSDIRKLSHGEIRAARPSEQRLLNMTRNPIYVIADNIRSLHNVGAIFRTSEAAGVEKIYLTGISGCPPRKEISKTAIGAEKSVPWEYHDLAIPVLEYMKSRNIPVIALEHTSLSVTYTNVNYDFPLCLVIGNEVEGISEDVIAYADMAVDIPMWGMKQSLNVSVAYGIMLFELIRQLG